MYLVGFFSGHDCDVPIDEEEPYLVSSGGSSSSSP